jgi:two-component system response regulator HydG
MRYRIAIAEPDRTCAGICARIVMGLGHLANVVESPADLHLAIGRGEFDVLLADEAFPGFNQREVMRKATPRIDVILIGQRGPANEAPGAPSQGVLERIWKPFSAEEFRGVLERALERKRLAQENALLRERLAARHELAGLVGSSAKMQRVYELIVKVAPARHPVLVLGESGTGKELVARAIHAFGPASGEPFVPIDCGALSPQLIESELFGHVRGAFTGANQNRTGLFVAAGRGSVFLDEIGELPIDLQAKLLRALQEKEVRPLGSNQRTPFHARMIAGTNQHLEAAITRGTFRKDLFFRLNVVTIKLPPLRERKEDIPALAYHFLERLAGDGSSSKGISYDTLARLMAYDWPGNVRELENCIQRAVTLGSGSEIQIHDLPSSLQYGLWGGESRSIPTLRQVEKRAILEALEATDGDRLRAAKLLGIGKTTIYRKVKEYGLQNSAPPEIPH